VLRALTDPEAALALSGWIYLLLAVAVAVAVDSIIPILPAEVLCIGAGAPAASGDVHAGLAVGVVATGRWSATPAPTNSGAPTPTAPACHAHQPRPSTSLRAHRARAQREPQRDIVRGRFVPGGRTCVGVPVRHHPPTRPPPPPAWHCGPPTSSGSVTPSGGFRRQQPGGVYALGNASISALSADGRFVALGEAYHPEKTRWEIRTVDDIQTVIDDPSSCPAPRRPRRRPRLHR